MFYVWYNITRRCRIQIINFLKFEIITLRYAKLLYSNLAQMKYSMLKNLKCDRALCFFCSTDMISSLISQMVWLECTWTLQKLFHKVWNSLRVVTNVKSGFFYCVVPQPRPQSNLKRVSSFSPSSYGKKMRWERGCVVPISWFQFSIAEINQVKLSKWDK